MKNNQTAYALLLSTGLLFYASQHTGSIMSYGQFNWLSVLVNGLLAIQLYKLTITGLYTAASFLHWLDSQTIKGKNGTAHFAKYNMVKDELSNKAGTPFWGRFADRGKQIIRAGYVSSVLTVAPAGSGKGIFTVVTNILGLRNASKLVIDFKGELSAMLAATLKKRGEKVRVLNPAGIFEHILGATDFYNPLDIIVDNLYIKDGLRDIANDLKEFASQLLPEPAGKSENTYFRNGSRNLIGMVIIIQCMIDTYQANLSNCALLLEDRTKFKHHLMWLVGVDVEGNPLPEGPMPIEMTDWAACHSEDDLNAFCTLIRARASNILKMMETSDNRTLESFIAGAQQALAGFSYGRISHVLSRSTFSMDELKDEHDVTTLFVLADASRIEAYKPYLGLIQWCAFTAIKRHKNKHVPVYAILDEATNYVIHGLASLLTWARGYGLKLHLIFQDFAAFERVYGREALQTLLSETEIKQFLPGQRSPQTLELIEKLCGQQSVISHSYADKGHLEGKSQNSSEAARALITADEIRRSDDGLLFIRKSPVIKFEPISYAEITPWRKQVGINPFHGKPFLKRIKIRLRGEAA